MCLLLPSLSSQALSAIASVLEAWKNATGFFKENKSLIAMTFVGRSWEESTCVTRFVG